MVFKGYTFWQCDMKDPVENFGKNFLAIQYYKIIIKFFEEIFGLLTQCATVQGPTNLKRPNGMGHLL